MTTFVFAKLENMRNDIDTFNKFQDSLKGLGRNLQVLDTTISVNKQMEYFKFIEHVRQNIPEDENVDELIEILNAEDTTFSEMKYVMARLAISGDVKAYRVLENYNKTPRTDLIEWSALSVLQAKITLEAEFSEEKQVFISTGLGGKGDKLRFYAFFKSADLEAFSAYQRDLIEKEFLFSINKHQAILEEINIESNYFTLLFLMKLQENIQNALGEALVECNQYGAFISPQFIITNVKIFNEQDIQKELAKK
jgi:hypothetical protein